MAQQRAHLVMLRMGIRIASCPRPLVELAVATQAGRHVWNIAQGVDFLHHVTVCSTPSPV